jgi:hypothetical protein
MSEDPWKEFRKPGNWPPLQIGKTRIRAADGLTIGGQANDVVSVTCPIFKGDGDLTMRWITEKLVGGQFPILFSRAVPLAPGEQPRMGGGYWFPPEGYMGSLRHVSMFMMAGDRIDATLQIWIDVCNKFKNAEYAAEEHPLPRCATWDDVTILEQKGFEPKSRCVVNQVLLELDRSVNGIRRSGAMQGGFSGAPLPWLPPIQSLRGLSVEIDGVSL